MIRTSHAAISALTSQRAVRFFLLAILVYASLLRLDALVGKWGVIRGSESAEAFQGKLVEGFRYLRPNDLTWDKEPYLSGDPYDDLRFARDMDSFYEASIREPVFVFVTRVFQDLTGQQPVAVCLASALFSVLVVWATYLVGRSAFSPWVGLGAALAVAVERDVIGQSVLGFKDEAFAFFVLLSAHGVLRTCNRPTRKNAATLGLVLGLACLTRITSLSFVLPVLGLLLIAIAPPLWRCRLTILGTATLVCSVVAAPYLINCWLEFGDPLYSISGRTFWYRAALGLTSEGSQDPGSFLYSVARAAPVRFAETGIIGLSTYPFEYKWDGFGPWLPALNGALRLLAIVGLFVFPWSAPGRRLLLVLLSSLLPYAFTWATPNFALVHHFRYTLHAYPFQLIAAVYVVWELGRFVVRERSYEASVSPPAWRTWLMRAGSILAVASTLWLALNVMPYFRSQEDLRTSGQATVFAGHRDRFFFRSGWHAPMTVGSVTARFARGKSAAVWIPLLRHRRHTVTIRLDPFLFPEAPRQGFAVRLNGTPLANFSANVNPERVGEYRLDIPAALATKSISRLDIEARYVVAVESARSGAGDRRSRPPSFDDLIDNSASVAFRVWAVVIVAHPTDDPLPLGEGEPQ